MLPLAWLQATDAPPSGGVMDFSNPLTWVNFGVLGFLVVGLFARKIVTRGEFDEWKANRDVEIARIQADHNREVARLEEDKTRLISERNQALAERDEAYSVVRDFNQTAAGLIGKLPTLSPDPRPRRRSSGSDLK